jgi:hypothetical protein
VKFEPPLDPKVLSDVVAAIEGLVPPDQAELQWEANRAVRALTTPPPSDIKAIQDWLTGRDDPPRSFLVDSLTVVMLRAYDGGRQPGKGLKVARALVAVFEQKLAKDGLSTE